MPNNHSSKPINSSHQTLPRRKSAEKQTRSVGRSPATGPAKGPSSSSSKTAQRPQNKSRSRPLQLNAPTPSFLKGFGGVSEGNTKEVQFKITQYLDIKFTTAKPVYSHYNSLEQSYVGRPGGLGAGDDQLSRPKSCTLYALPRFSATTPQDEVFTVLSAVRATTTANTFTEGTVTLGQANQTLIPEATPRWIKLNHWNYDRLFDQNFVNPLVVSGATTKELFMELFSLSAIDPDGAGKVFEQEFQLKIVYTFAQTMPIENLSRTGNIFSEDWNTYTAFSPAPTYALVEPIRLSNVS